MNITLKLLGFNKFKEQELFLKTYIETQFFMENSLVQKSSFKRDLDIQNLFKIRSISLFNSQKFSFNNTKIILTNFRKYKFEIQNF